VKGTFTLCPGGMEIKMRIFDTRCDTIETIGEMSLYDCDRHYNFKKAAMYNTHIQMLNIWVDNAIHNPRERVDTLIETFNRETKNVNVIKTSNDLRKASGVCVLLGIEGGEGIGGKLERLKELFEKGLRLLTLTWNHQNEISGTAAENGGGLTPFGFEVLTECEHLGIMVDVSHLSDRGFYDVAANAEKPFIASHSNSRALCPVSRNLTDDQFRFLVKTGGAAGINLYSKFLGENADLNTVVSHIEHFCALGGEYNIGIGSDFDGMDIMPEELNGAEDLYKLADALAGMNYTDELIDCIFFKNMENIFMKILSEIC